MAPFSARPRAPRAVVVGAFMAVPALLLLLAVALQGSRSLAGRATLVAIDPSSGMRGPVRPNPGSIHAGGVRACRARRIRTSRRPSPDRGLPAGSCRCTCPRSMAHFRAPGTRSWRASTRR